MEPHRLNGVFPVVQTPFLENGAIDLDGLERELHWILDQGVSGLTTGMVSEILRLNEDERHQLAAMVTSVARERGALAILSCGAESTRLAIRYASAAADLGAQGIMVIPPTTVSLGEEATFDYFVAIADATDLAVVVQDASAYVGQPLSIALQARLQEELGPQVYFKPEAPPLGQRLSQLREATSGAARSFEGTAGVNLVDAFHRGVIGSMPGGEVCWAIEVMWRALTTGDLEQATRINAYLALLVNVQTCSIPTWRLKSTCCGVREYSSRLGFADPRATCSTTKLAKRSTGCSSSCSAPPTTKATLSSDAKGTGACVLESGGPHRGAGSFEQALERSRAGHQVRTHRHAYGARGEPLVRVLARYPSGRNERHLRERATKRPEMVNSSR